MKLTWQLSGWSRARRVVVFAPTDHRRCPPGRPRRPSWHARLHRKCRGRAAAYEYAVLVTSTDYEMRALAQLYRDRADAENNFDEWENQWGLSGFTTQDLKRCRLMAGMVTLVYNW